MKHNHEHGSITEKQIAILLMLFSALICLDRWPSLYEPFERDLMIYAMTANGLLQGQSLYSNLWDQKPPAIHLTYAAFIFVFGLKPIAIWMMGVAASIISMLGCFVAGLRIAGKKCGIVAATIWLLLNGDVLLQANQPNVEVFINCCLVWAFALTLSHPNNNSKLNALGVGFLFFLATLYKLNTCSVAFGVVAALLACSLFRDDRARLKERIKWASLAGGTAVMGWLLVFGYFWQAGSLSDFYTQVFEYNREVYAGDLLRNISLGFSPQHFSTLMTTQPQLTALCAITIIGITWRLKNGWDSSAVMLLSYIISAYIAVTLPGKWFHHYYQLLLPSLSVGAASLFTCFRCTPRVWKFALLSFFIIYILMFRVQYKLMSNDAHVVAKYGKDDASLFIDSKKLAHWINENYSMQQTVYHWGADPGVYFWSSRSSPTSFTYNYPLLTQFGFDKGYVTKALNELKFLKPALIVALKPIQLIPELFLRPAFQETSHWSPWHLAPRKNRVHHREMEKHSRKYATHPIEKWIHTNYRLIGFFGSNGNYTYRLFEPKTPNH